MLPGLARSNGGERPGPGNKDRVCGSGRLRGLGGRSEARGRGCIMKRRFPSLRPPACVAAGAVLLLTIALTACGGGSVTTSAGSPSASADAAASSAEPTALPAPTVAGTLAFAHAGGEIALIDADGSGLTMLAKGGSAAVLAQPAWSPDGRRIAFVKSSGIKTMTIWIVDADGSGLRKLATASSTSFSPAWSPDGGRLAFMRLDPATGRERLAIVDTDGSDLRTLPAKASLGTYNVPAAWASDGDIYGVWGTDVYRTDPDGRRVIQVTKTGDVGAFAVSPDAARLAIFNLQDDCIELRPNGGAGDALVVVDELSAYIDEPSVNLTWSPDGRAIAFAKGNEIDAAGALYVVNADGTGLSKVPDTDGRAFSPAWRPE